MNKCSCGNCDLEVFENSDKCILHCEKDGWNNLENKDKKSFDYFWQTISEIISKINSYNDNINYIGIDETKQYVFENIHFSLFSFNNIGNTKYSHYTPYLLPDGKLEEGDVSIENLFYNIKPDIDIIFKNCIFEEEVDFTTLEILNNIIFKEDCIFKKGINFSNNLFTHKITLKSSNKIIINCENTIFNEYIEFTNIDIESLFLKNTTFNKNLNLIESKVERPIDLSTAIIKSNINLYQFKCNVANRETARIIKDSFEKQNNIIEANKFYALEMEKREKELDFKENFFEWLVFKIHGLSSNHSQDWTLALFWILSFTFTFLTMDFVNTHYLTHTVDYILIDMIIFLGFVYGNYLIIEYEKINKFLYIGIYYIFYGFFSQDWLLKCFSNRLNPFSIMTGNEELTFSGLIYKIIIAYLIYQLIISIRQNTRRK
ncbi:hypothetical protein N5U06_04950 [Aliarcobacter butzleri]|uniref:hypothetical protein n=1 Tax=Aliarcobacter butzleri TaxID=28197 RepID=UPI0021B335E2|nr:hypothetical protein [Aliarcobacter butzleri]MCT7576666.1 hypothetical protein [Aliarcobacter butzleri]MCT7592203.1 hypothetical protein [Aliarcobacter butzleri]MCT7630075.1 hypothetical protein [Aliarcobacter butzleri]